MNILSTTNQFPVITQGNDIRVKLSSKRLGAGKCQVKFQAQHGKQKSTKGHMLVDANLTLREVVEIIKEKVACIDQHKMQHHTSFYTLNQSAGQGGFIFFEA